MKATYFLKDGSQHCVPVSDDKHYSTDSFRDTNIHSLTLNDRQVIFTGDKISRIEVTK